MEFLRNIAKKLVIINFWFKNGKSESIGVSDTDLLVVFTKTTRTAKRSQTKAKKKKIYETESISGVLIAKKSRLISLRNLSSV